MQTTTRSTITVKASIQAPLPKVWELWTEPAHIIHWNNASPDWCTPRAENDLRPGGKFLYRMEARDGSFGFDFWGVYDTVRKGELIAYTLGDNRKVSIHFSADGPMTRITQTFEPESQNALELQETGWQAILDNFRAYTESHH
jgi:uncharacterized protein YndB with AHSA1/START domain